MQEENLVFKLKISQKEVEEIILRAIQADNQISQREEKYFTQMFKHGNHFLLEFVVPVPKE